MSDWFKNDPSEIPDEMWRAATPMQRQADAVVLWAELTGKHASNCGNHGPAKPKKKATKTKTASVGPNRLSQADIAGARPLSSAPPRTRARLTMLRKTMPKAMYSKNRDTGIVYKLASAKAQEAILAAARYPALTGAAIGAPVGAAKAYLDNRSQPGSVSSREAKAIGALAAAKSKKLSDKKIRALEKRLAKAREEKKSVGKQVLKGTAAGAGIGAVFGAAHKAIRQKG